MKLIKDFGIRALIAVIAGCGFYGVIFYVLVHFDLEPTTIIAIATTSQAPFLTALAFYFGQKKTE